MNDPFDETGHPIKSIDDFGSTLETKVRLFLFNMVQEGYSATQIRAVGSYFSNAVECAISHNVLDVADRVRKEQIRNADPNLDAEEIFLCHYWYNEATQDVRSRPILATGFDVIKAIKHYRERTGKGLRESKDAVEAYCQGIIVSSIAT